MKSLTLTDFLSSPQTDTFIESAQPFFKLMMQYQCAMLEIQTKFQVLNTEMSLDRDHKSIESITCRLKQPKSIIDKLRRRNIEINLKNIETELHDVAGIRVICSFPDDIYKLAEKICSQDDVTLIEKKDYIASPKPNGYRSLHLILEIPVFFANETKKIKVEVQLRTIAMDFWASIEHKVRYKKENIVPQYILDDLRQCADRIYEMDLHMQKISHQIEQYNLDKKI